MNPESDSSGPTWRALLWGALAGVLAISLVVKALDAHSRNATLHRRLKAIDAELDRVRAEQNRMRAEKKSLSEDPFYLESVLQGPPAGRSREPIVEK